MPAPDPAKMRRAATDAVVFDDAGRILLQHRADFDMWGLPGGSIETGETLVESVVREVKEESGLDIEVVRLIGAYSEPESTTTRYPDGNLVHYVSLTFECRVTGGALRPQRGESKAVRFFDPNDLPQPVLRDHLPRIRDALAREPGAFVR
ncbi:MAG TPA: NUDIX domain-containing protein [Tepidisphaeraceae bacterium]|nr:NUDIX domain-containing protein [Tepidisphaeraceae bacterium]